MANEVQRAPGAQIAVGLLVVAVGVLFLLDNLGVIAFRHSFDFWPLALVAGGASLVVSDRKRSSRKAGTILIVIGAVLLLQRLGLMDISWRVVWPLVMIAAGGLILYRTLGAKRVQARPDFAGAEPGSVVDVTAIMGGIERRLATNDFRGGDVTAIMGGADLDLRGCSMTKEAVLDVFAFWGGITVRVPADWTVVLNGQPLMAGFTQKTAPPADSGKRLVVTGWAVMGGIEVRN